MGRRGLVLGALGAVVLAGGVLAAVLLTGQDDQTASAPPPPAPGEPGSPWTTRPADVLELKTGPGDRSLVVLIQVPGPDPSCVREPHIDHLTETAGAITADVLYSAKTEACPEKVPVELRLSTTSPIAERTVTLNGAPAWHRAGGGWAH